MAYAQQVAKNTQETTHFLASGTWTALEGSTALANRFMTKVFVKGAASDRVALTYDNTKTYKDSSHELGPGSIAVEPNGPGRTLYGMAKPSSNNTVRVVVTEYSN